MSNFRAIDRKTGYLLPPSVDEWLPERHLARFIVDVIDGLDLCRMSRAYRGTGSASYHPRALLSILVYGYATGVFSSRKLERATWDSVAFRYIAGGEHPDHDTIATFRRRFLKDIEKLFVDVLRLAREMGVLKMGTIGLDGTKIHANASRHSALSYEHAGKIEAQLTAEVADLMAKAEAADATEIPDGMSVPAELARREERLRRIAEARATIEARAKERHARDGGARSQNGGARGEDRGDGQEAWRQAAAAAGRRTAAERSGQSDGRRVAHHAGGGRRVRAVLQRAGGGGGGKPAGGGDRCCPGAQRQGPGRTHAGEDRSVARGTGQGRESARGHRLFQRRQRRSLREGRRRTRDRDGPSAALPSAERTLRADSGRAAKAHAGRGDGLSTEDAGRPGALRAAQADPRTGVRHHQVRARIPSIFTARAR